jgi:glycosyltransferase involved in cell wall biosynthesis
MSDSGAHISVVIPLYNKETVVQRTIDSVLRQTYSHFEVIVVNDGSTDGGPAVVREIQDSRIRLIDQDNSGVSAARNRGVLEARYELIAFLDADDEWLPDFLETVIGLASRFPDAGAYSTGYVIVKEKEDSCRNVAIKGRQDKCGCYFDIFKKGGGVCSSSIVVRRRVFDRAGSFREGYRLSEDMDMWFRIGLHFPVSCSPKICAIYHYYESNSACSEAVPNRVSPLHISSLELRRNTQLDPVVKRKAEKYLSYHRAKDIEYICLKGFRDIAKHRLELYQRHCGFNMFYLKLCVLNALPSCLLSAIASIRLKLVHVILLVAKNMMQVYFIVSLLPDE